MNKMIKKNTITQLTLLSSAVLMLVLVAISQPSNAYDNDQANSSSNQSSERRGPPPEAFTACDGKNAGDTSQFENKRGEILTGTCEEARGQRSRENSKGLVLRPNKQKSNNNRRTPPAEAFTACEGKSAGEASQFESRRGEVLKGTCEESNGKLVLRPERFTK